MQKSLKSLGKMSRTRKLVAALPFALAATGAFAGVVGTLPEPTVVDGKNVYTLGTSMSTALPTREDAETNYDYIDWASLNVPAGSVVKLNGAVVLDALPADLTITTYAGGAPTNEKGESVFNDWTVVPVGKWGQVRIEKVVKDTGLYLRMRRENAFHIIIR